MTEKRSIKGKGEREKCLTIRKLYVYVRDCLWMLCCCLSRTLIAVRKSGFYVSIYMTSSLFGGCFSNNMSIFLSSLMPFGDVGGKIKRSFTFPFFFAFLLWRSRLGAHKSRRRVAQLRENCTWSSHIKRWLLLARWWIDDFSCGHRALLGWELEVLTPLVFVEQFECQVKWVAYEIFTVHKSEGPLQLKLDFIVCTWYQFGELHIAAYTLEYMLCCVCTFFSSFSCSRNLE